MDIPNRDGLVYIAGLAGCGQVVEHSRVFVTRAEPHFQGTYRPLAVFARSCLVTLSEALAGLGLSIVIGVPLAMLLVWSRVLDQALTPLLVVSQTFPKVAIAPLLVIWFGLGFFPKALVSFLVAFFPIVVAGVQGMRSVEPELLELIQSYRANDMQIFWKIRLPAALPSLFAGFKLAATFSIIGAVVGEWVGANKGLGHVLLWANADLDTPLVFAAVVCLAGLGSLLYYLVHGIERLVLPWHVSAQATEILDAMRSC